jgi:hypothetical protein
VVRTMSGPYLVGNGQGAMDLGLGSIANQGGRDIVVASYDNSGVAQWVKSFGGTGDQTVITAVADTTGIWLAGTYDTSFILGTTTLPTPGVPAAGSFVTKLDAAGNPVWVHEMGGSPSSIAIDDNRFSLLTGDFNGTVDFGGGSVSAVGSSDVFVMKLGK